MKNIQSLISGLVLSPLIFASFAFADVRQADAPFALPQELDPVIKKMSNGNLSPIGFQAMGSSDNSYLTSCVTQTREAFRKAYQEISTDPHFVPMPIDAFSIEVDETGQPLNHSRDAVSIRYVPGNAPNGAAISRSTYVIHSTIVRDPRTGNLRCDTINADDFRNPMMSARQVVDQARTEDRLVTDDLNALSLKVARMNAQPGAQYVDPNQYILQNAAHEPGSSLSPLKMRDVRMPASCSDGVCPWDNKFSPQGGAG